MTYSGNSRHETADLEQHTSTSHPLQTTHTWHTYLQTDRQTYRQTGPSSAFDKWSGHI